MGNCSCGVELKEEEKAICLNCFVAYTKRNIPSETLYSKLEREREERLKVEELKRLEEEERLLHPFKPLTPIIRGRILKFLSVKTRFNNSAKIYTRGELLFKCLEEKQFNNSLMEKSIIKNNLKEVY